MYDKLSITIPDLTFAEKGRLCVALTFAIDATGDKQISKYGELLTVLIGSKSK